MTNLQANDCNYMHNVFLYHFLFSAKMKEIQHKACQVGQKKAGKNKIYSHSLGFPHSFLTSVIRFDMKPTSQCSALNAF